MIEQYDQHLFLFLNSLNTPFLDQVMWIISAKITWVPVYLAILIYLGIKNKNRLYIIILMVIVAITLSDQMSVVLKNLTQRPRPCHEEALYGMVHIVRGYCGGLYSFVSSHASNSFTVAFFSLFFIRRRWFSTGMIIWALVIGYSRVYLGVHYPGDIICGSILGALIGSGVFRLYKWIEIKFLNKSEFFTRGLSVPPPLC
jgi:undecaprenyl-diphosphatase